MKKIISILLLVLWMLFIFYLSHQPGSISSVGSEGILTSIVTFVLNVFNLDTNNINSVVEFIHIPARELMHLFEYLILGILVINVLNMYEIDKIVVISIMLCFIYSVSDEVHQAFVAGRTFQYLDILMDNIGSIVGILFYKYIKKI